MSWAKPLSVWNSIVKETMPSEVSAFNNNNSNNSNKIAKFGKLQIIFPVNVEAVGRCIEPTGH